MTVLTRFETKFNPEPYSGCWIWHAYVDKDGYGEFRMPTGRSGGRRVRAHRMAWELYIGEIPEGYQINHACDTPSCVNPAHLSPGSQSDNLYEMSARKRHRWAKRSYPPQAKDSKGRYI